MELNYEALNNVMASNAASNNAQARYAAQRQMAYQTNANAKAMAFNAQQAQINREWQERMSNTAHQREVQDLIAAGLNPVLSANSGASTPVGSSATGVTSAGAMAEVDTSKNAAISGIIQSMLSADVARENAELNATTSMHNANVSAKAVTDAAAIAAAASRYATDNPNTYAGLVRTVIEGLTGTKTGASGAKTVAEKATDIGDTIRETLEKTSNPVVDREYHGPNDVRYLLKTLIYSGQRPTSNVFGKRYKIDSSEVN